LFIATILKKQIVIGFEKLGFATYHIRWWLDAFVVELKRKIL